MSEATQLDYYERAGGADGVRALVEHFYAVMESNPAYKKLRDMHAPDLGPVCEDFIGFLTLWLGGPRDWLAQRGGFCVMSRHAPMGITPETARQWLAAMDEALAARLTDTALRAKMAEAFARLADGMLRMTQARRA
ncbi:group II truncated hemoglobin [Acidocella facilis]|uniref:group II truncated hemoglobin n=1 Tax=Acidocella facilis TaxID=525 RepID=UPI00047B3B93|nr:group II truncated hemoglobin [Acidocella facilis]